MTPLMTSRASRKPDAREVDAADCASDARAHDVHEVDEAMRSYAAAWSNCCASLSEMNRVTSGAGWPEASSS